MMRCLLQVWLSEYRLNVIHELGPQDFVLRFGTVKGNHSYSDNIMAQDLLILKRI